MSDHHPQFEPRDERIPPELQEDLAEVTRRRVYVPPDTERAVLGAARSHLRGVRRRRWFARAAVGAAGAVAAAAAAVILLVVQPWMGGAADSRNLRPRLAQRAPSPAASATPPPPAPADLNDDGELDILDAYALARRLKSPSPVPHWWDFDGDGRVGPGDVDALAARAVRLSGGPRS